jgi:hypothetical protein
VKNTDIPARVKWSRPQPGRACQERPTAQRCPCTSSSTMRNWRGTGDLRSALLSWTEGALAGQRRFLPDCRWQRRVAGQSLPVARYHAM